MAELKSCPDLMLHLVANTFAVAPPQDDSDDDDSDDDDSEDEPPAKKGKAAPAPAKAAAPAKKAAAKVSGPPRNTCVAPPIALQQSISGIPWYLCTLGDTCCQNALAGSGQDPGSIVVNLPGFCSSPGVRGGLRSGHCRAGQAVM